jgi:hypothetical protein
MQEDTQEPFEVVDGDSEYTLTLKERRANCQACTGKASGASKPIATGGKSAKNVLQVSRWFKHTCGWEEQTRAANCPACKAQALGKKSKRKHTCDEWGPNRNYIKATAQKDIPMRQTSNDSVCVQISAENTNAKTFEQRKQAVNKIWHDCMHQNPEHEWWQTAHERKLLENGIGCEANAAPMAKAKRPRVTAESMLKKYTCEFCNAVYLHDTEKYANPFDAFQRHRLRCLARYEKQQAAKAGTAGGLNETSMGVLCTHGCGKWFANVRNMRAHVKLIHEKKVSYKCVLCDFETVYKHKMKHHYEKQAIHENEPPERAKLVQDHLAELRINPQKAAAAKKASASAKQAPKSAGSASAKKAPKRKADADSAQASASSAKATPKPSTKSSKKQKAYPSKASTKPTAKEELFGHKNYADKITVGI